MKRLFIGRRSRQTNAFLSDPKRWRSIPGGRLYTARPIAQVKRINWGVRIVVFWLSALLVALLLALAHITRIDTAIDNRNEFLRARFMIEEAKNALSDMEAGNRGFLLTGDEEFRRPFDRASDTFSACSNELLAATAGAPVQQTRLRAIRNKMTQWFNLYNPLVQKRRREGDRYKVSAADRASLLQCNRLFGEIHLLLDEMSTFEAEDFSMSR